MFTQSIGPTKLCTQSGASTLGPPLTRSPNQIGQQKSFGATPQSPNNHKCQSQAKVCIVFDFQQHKWPEQASWLAAGSLVKGRGQRGGSYGWHICRRIINWNKLIFAEYWTSSSTSSSTRRRTNTTQTQSRQCQSSLPKAVPRPQAIQTARQLQGLFTLLTSGTKTTNNTD